MIDVIRVSSRGQIVIPEKVRRHLGIETGSKLILLEREGTITLQKEEEIERHLQESERRETAGWLMLAERSLHDIWDNPRDEKAWKRYL